jgi:aminoglycoside phosphotransferase (APT) family kinase protein
MDPEGIRLEPLSAWMRDQGIDVDASVPLRAELLAGGRSNISYRLIDDSGRDWVLRRPPLGHILPSAHDMGREFRVLSGLSSVGFPVPRPVAECTDPDVIGAPFLLMDFVPGRVIDDAAAAASIDAGEAADICRSLTDTLVDLHAVDPAQAGLDSLGRPDGYLERQVGRWTQQWSLTRTRDLADVDTLAAALAGRVGAVPSMPGVIVHGDYRIDNTILAADAPQVCAVLDWEMSTLGDPVSDLAVMLVYWTDAGDTLRAAVPVAQHITDRPGFWSRAQIVERYAERSGRSLDHLDFCTALACFKLAVIMESILARSLQGQQLGTGADEIDAMRQSTEALAALGLRVLDEGAIDGLAS